MPRSRIPLLLAGLVLVATVMRSPITGVGPLLPRIDAELGLGPSASGLLTALPLLAFAGASAVVPGVAHRWGNRATLLAGLAAMCAGAGLRWVPAGGAAGVGALYGGTLLVGVAIAVANVLLPALLRSEFPARVAALTSGYVVVMGLGAAFSSGTAEPLADSAPGGWRTALAVWALPALLAVAVWARIRLGPAGRPATGGATGAVPGTGPARMPWRSGLAWQVSAFMGLQSVGFYVALAWLPTLLRDRAGLDAVAAGWQLFLLQVAGLLASSSVPLLLRGRRSRVAPAVACSLLTAAGFGLLLLAPAAVALSSVLLGLGMGTSVVLALSFLGERAADARGAAALSGMAQAVGYLLAAAGPVVVGVLNGATGGWEAPLALLLALSLVQAGAGWAAGRPRTVR
ncbi:MFS transporter [Kineococcus sp. NUM-3379]